MEQMQNGYYVLIGMHTIRSDTGESLTIPLYMQVVDEKAYKTGRERVLSGISQIFIEKYRERLRTAEVCANG